MTNSSNRKQYILKMLIFFHLINMISVVANLSFTHVAAAAAAALGN
jgi:hypothetical protein